MLTQDLAATLQQTLTAAPHGYNREVATVQTRITQLGEQYGRRNHLGQGRLEEFARLISRREALRSGLSGVRVEDRSLPGEPSLEGLQAYLCPEQAFVEFAELGKNLLAVYVDADTVVNYRIDAPVISLADTLKRLVTPGRVDVTAFAPTSLRLYRALFGPVDALLAGKRDLLLVPSLLLSDLPTAALVVSDTGEVRYLLDRHVLRHLDSWKTYQQGLLIRESRRPGGVLRAGMWTNPELKKYFSAVTSTLQQQESFPVDHYGDGESGTDSYLENAGAYDLLHFSVHARGSDRSLNDNYLYFSPTDSLNGIVIGGLPLRANLVVLAACSTARGYVGRSEGAFSIRRSFHRAGVPEVISTLYDTNAGATATLIDAFYTYLLQGMEPAEALTQAQRQCRAGVFGKAWRSPYYWAGMVIG